MPGLRHRLAKAAPRRVRHRGRDDLCGLRHIPNILPRLACAGGWLVRRKGRRGDPFLGCIRCPDCNGTRQIQNA
ncbi:MAG: topoisomerase DNA-binding C4 zinc finger domain-containing protein [Rhodobacteraceae bacterium]|nr:topoisomerase DNA-binding C4 zinc finger domain-containing protein [Paracoccaceae bacterium]